VISIMSCYCDDREDCLQWGREAEYDTFSEQPLQLSDSRETCGFPHSGDSAVLVIPAIDLIDGRCVRLRQGVYADTTVYDGDPEELARRFVAEGAQRIHLVDLDAARGTGDNRAVIRRIREAVSVTLEVGGGLRDRESLDRILEMGIDYAILGTVLARQPDEVARWASDGGRGSRMVASIDARDGFVQVSGWQESSTVTAVDLARVAGEIGLAAVEYTNIARDGMLTGPDIAGTRMIASGTSIPVILSGGIAATDDAARIAREGHGAIAGFIVGRAMYEGSFDLRAAIDAIKRFDRADPSEDDGIPSRSAPAPAPTPAPESEAE
jgi:phosphoribosylformimino-5-aminoimidazole carboxamide ribotide isomerase